MKLERVTGMSFRTICKNCNTAMTLHVPCKDNPTGKIWADLSGKPFEDYYCDDCATMLKSTHK